MKVKLIRDEFNLLPVLWKLGHSSEYLEDIEKLIEDKAEELDKRRAKMIQEIKQEPGGEDEDLYLPRGWSREEVNIHLLDISLEDDFNKIEKAFPNLLRRSLFIYVYSVLENTLNNCCRLLNFQSRPLADVKGKDAGIKRARRYLEDANVHFPDEKWENIINYQKLRNCITHNQGRLKGCNHEEDVRKFALSNPYLSLMHTYEGDQEFIEVVFHKGFCEEVIQTISNFLEQLQLNMEHRHRNEDF